MTQAEATSTLAGLAASELWLARLTGGPLPPDDLLAAAVGWCAVTGLVLLASARATHAVGAVVVLLGASVAVPPVLDAWGTVPALALAAGWTGAVAGAWALAPAERRHVLAAASLFVAVVLATAPGVAVPSPAVLLSWALGTAGLMALATRAAGLLAVGLAYGLAAAPTPTSPADTGAPDVLLVTVDALRADAALDTLDRLGAHGHAGEAWAPAPWTLPALGSFLTGTPPERHGAGRSTQGFHGLDPGLPTLAAAMRRAGWRTTAVSGPNPFTGHRHGLLRGFTHTWHPWEPAAAPLPRGRSRHARPRPLLARWVRPAPPPRDDDAVMARALTALAQPGPDLVWVHLMGLHLPYDDVPDGAEILTRPDARAALSALPPDALEPLLATWRRAYAAQVAALDATLLDALDALDLDTTLVVLTADHGEALGEVGIEHGHTLQPEVTRVPLVWSTAGRTPPTGDGALTDVPATLLALLDLPATLPGADLAAGDPGPTQLGHTLYGPPQHAVVDGPWMWLEDADGGHLIWWDAPPEDRRDRAHDLPDHAARLAALLARPMAPWGPAVDPDLRALQALGYVDGGPP